MKTINQEIKSEFDSNKQKAVINVMFSSNWIRNRNNEILNYTGISLQQYNILRILRGTKNKMNMNEVKERMIDKSPNMTRLTDKLIEKELIIRIRSEEDRRVVYVQISSEGLELLNELDEPIKEISSVYDTLSEEEAGQLSDLLDKLRGCK